MNTRPLSGLRVLVVEDDDDSRDLLGEYLQSEGASVETAPDAACGMEALLRFKPAVLLSDIGMPGEDGLSFMRRCRQLPHADERGVVAIAVTAYCRPEDRARTLAAGFDEYVPKPLDLPSLVQKIVRLTRAPSLSP